MKKLFTLTQTLLCIAALEVAILYSTYYFSSRYGSWSHGNARYGQLVIPIFFVSYIIIFYLKFDRTRNKSIQFVFSLLFAAITSVLSFAVFGVLGTIFLGS